MKTSARVFFVIYVAVNSATSTSLPFRNYSTTEGLAHNHINRIYRDSQGFLWICTDEGLSRFDGGRFANYTVAHGLPHIHVNDFLESRTGDYFVATDAGLTRFQPRSAENRFIPLGPPGPPKAREVNALFEDRDGSILLGTSAGLFRFRGRPENFEQVSVGFPTNFDDGPKVNFVFRDRQGVLWVAAASGLYSYGSDRLWKRLTTFEKSIDFINSIAEDQQGQLWVCTRLHGFGRLAGTEAGRARLDPHFDTGNGLPGPDVRSLWFGSDGRRWAATSSGLVEWSDPRRIHVFTTKQGLRDDAIYGFAEDLTGNLWMGTRRGGLMRMAAEDFTTFDQSDGLSFSQDEMVLETRSGEVCVVNVFDPRRSVQCLSGDRFQAFLPALPRHVRGEAPNFLQTVMQDHLGNWWIATNHAIGRSSSSQSAGQLPRSAIKQIMRGIEANLFFEDSHGDIWIAVYSWATGARLLRWRRDLDSVEDESRTVAPDLLQQGVSAFTEVRGQLWVGLAHGGGVLRRRGRKFEIVASTLRGRINALYPDRSNRLWVASVEGGLGRIDKPEANAPRVEVLTQLQGLSSNEIWSLTEDRFGRIYAGNARGVDRIDPNGDTMLHFTEADGFVRGDIRSAIQDRHGALWFLSNRGLSRYRPSTDATRPSSRPRIKSLIVAGRPVPISDLGETELGPLVFPSNQNSLTIEFETIQFAATSSAVLYQYRLEGASGDWSDPSSDSKVTLANLSPGQYELFVRSAPAASTTRPAATLRFQVLSPLWRRWWFQALIWLSIGGLMLTLHRFQLKRKLALEHVRTRIAMDLHDDVGASLSRVAVMAEVLKRQVVPADLHSDRILSDIADTSRGIVENMRDIVWSIHQNQPQMGETLSRIREFASRLLEPEEIHCDIDVPARTRGFRLSTEQAHNFYLICKEAIHNVARHSKAHHMTFRIRIERGMVCAEIEDDGCGMTNGVNTSGLGLKSMQMRAEELGGKLQILPAAVHGTLILIRFPVKLKS